MALEFKLNATINLDLDKVLTIRPVGEGVQLTYLNGEMETITPVAEKDLNRLFDFWLARDAATA